MPPSKGPGQSTVTPTAPAEGRSAVFSEKKLRNDHALFRLPGDPTSMTISDVQTALYERLRPIDPITAWEFALARKHDEWDDFDRIQVQLDLNAEENAEYAHIFSTPPSRKDELENTPGLEELLQRLVHLPEGEERQVILGVLMAHATADNPNALNNFRRVVGEKLAELRVTNPVQ